MNLVFMGTPDFAVPCLERVLQDGHRVLAVFTQPDKPKGRGYQLAPPPVKEFALKNGLEVFQPTKLRDGTVLAQLQSLKPDCIVVVAYGRILPKDILEAAPLGCINVHGSLLPKYRGAAPIQWSVLNGDAEAGITTMHLAEGPVDCGDMILKKSIPIGENETSGELYDRLAPLGAQCLSETLHLLETGSAPMEAQDESQITLAPMLTKEMAKIDFAKSAWAVHNLVRGMSPWPVAHTAFEGKLLKVHRAKVCEGSGLPGEILDDKRLVIACGEGAVELLEVQLEGSKRLPAEVFLRGHAVTVGKNLITL